MRPVWLQHREKIGLLIFFALLGGMGIWLCPDYGVALDAKIHQMNGDAAFKAYTTGKFTTDQLPPNHANHHGPAFQVLLRLINNFLGNQTIEQIFYIRHLVTFFFFLWGMYWFYWVSKFFLGSSGWAFLALLMVVSYPRIFAHAFFNSTDIPFLAMICTSLAAILAYRRQPDRLRTLIMAVAIGVTMSIKILGGLMLMILLFFLGEYFVFNKQRIGTHHLPRPQLFKQVIGFTGVLLGTMLLLYPHLWGNPFYAFFAALSSSAITGYQVPWSYDLSWLMRTLPMGVLGGICLFALFETKQLLSIDFSLKKQANPVPLFSFTGFSAYVLFIWAVIPFALVIIFDANLYNGWRHHYFTYPALVIIGLTGWKNWITRSKIICSPAKKKLVWVILLGFTLAPIHANIRLHPFQNVYFNAWGLASLKKESSLELDYSGNSYYAAMRFLLDHAQQQRIRIVARDFPAQMSYGLLNKQEQERLHLTVISDYSFEQDLKTFSKMAVGSDAPSQLFTDEEMTQRVLKNHRATMAAHFMLVTYKPWEEIPRFPLYHVIKAGDIPILGIYRIQ